MATLGYFISQRFGRRFLWVFDTDMDAARSAARVLGAKQIAHSATQIFQDPGVDTVYIASNHHSHAEYAISALESNKNVYVEKPVSVSLKQFERLQAELGRTQGRLFVGYNRPFSKAIQTLRSQLGNSPTGGVSLNCFVSGHLIGADHWYRNPDEGTRICGNAGHWIDLFIHILAWRGLPKEFRIHLLSADQSEPDDNFSLSIATEKNDIFTLMLTARTEPFEGINETINFQQDDIICKIDDFRRMTVWNGPAYKRWRFWPKDAGHKTAALQPFDRTNTRDWTEIKTSTLIMLQIMEMVHGSITTSQISLHEPAVNAVENGAVK